jgi:hypothetical protein
MTLLTLPAILKSPEKNARGRMSADSARAKPNPFPQSAKPAFSAAKRASLPQSVHILFLPSIGICG